jgi:hypothetical protein
MLTFLTPMEHGIGFCELMQGMGHLCIPLDELPEVIGQTKEGPDFLYIGQDWPIFDCLYLSRIWLDAILPHQVAKENGLLLKEGTLA